MPVDWETLAKISLIWLCGCLTPLICGTFGYALITMFLGVKQLRKEAGEADNEAGPLDAQSDFGDRRVSPDVDDGDANAR